ncbi:DUF5336 domain-containing protein [Streptomyces graminilatus]|uniref:DUF5336 domain-containing protein n=1 Tax=Streptomyces graminilatus TaxID=1464070 RepID=UPI0006E261C1|nr:DUF5336 domain-containing protein [Streptomyces graminilatus]
MNIRSLTRGDGVVIGAAVLLFIASFLDIYSVDGAPANVDLPSAWASGPVLLGVVFAGLIGAALVVLSHGLPQVPKVAGLDLGQFGAAFTVFAALSALGNVFDPSGGLDNVRDGVSGPDAGTGLILSLVATVVMAAAAIASPLVPALKGPLVGAPKPAAPQPYGGGQPYPGGPAQGSYGYPGADAQQQPYGGQAQTGQPFGAGTGAGLGAGQPQAQPSAPEFSPFWFAVPVPRPLFAEDGSSTPIAELAPGTWYLAVEQRGQGFIAQTQDGRRGVLQDTSGIQRG